MTMNFLKSFIYSSILSFLMALLFAVLSARYQSLGMTFAFLTLISLIGFPFMWWLIYRHLAPKPLLLVEAMPLANAEEPELTLMHPPRTESNAQASLPPRSSNPLPPETSTMQNHPVAALATVPEPPPFPKTRHVLKFYAADGTGNYLLAECEGCGSILKIKKESAYKTETGYALNPTIQCPCGAAHTKILGHLPATTSTPLIPAQQPLKDGKPQTSFGTGCATLIFGLTFAGIMMWVTGGGPLKSLAPEFLTSSTKNEAPDYGVQATQLYASYVANEVAADQRYKGKVIIVGGEVERIAKDIGNSAYITLKTDATFDSVQCFFRDADATQAARIHKGAYVRIKGRCEGKFGNILLKDCVVE